MVLLNTNNFQTICLIYIYIYKHVLIFWMVNHTNNIISELNLNLSKVGSFWTHALVKQVSLEITSCYWYHVTEYNLLPVTWREWELSQINSTASWNAMKNPVFYFIVVQGNRTILEVCVWQGNVKALSDAFGKCNIKSKKLYIKKKSKPWVFA